MYVFDWASVSELVGDFAVRLVLAVLVFIASWVVISIVNAFLGRLFDKTDFDRTLEKFVHKTTISALWLVTIGIILVVLGVDVSAVVASFGVLSFIVGFALKDTLGNFAAGVMILLNKPFRVDDEIEVVHVRGTVRGFVKSVTMSYTKILDKEGNKVVIPNTVVWSNPVTNYSAYKNNKVK